MLGSSMGPRRRVAELMDDPSLGVAEHIAALAGLERINRISAVARAVWPRVERVAREAGRSIRLLDIATGAGDLPRALARLGHRRGLRIEAAGSDASPAALIYAARRAGSEPVEFFRLDPLREPIPRGFDVITCALFLHHLSEADAAALLGSMKEAAGRAVIVDDLRRDRVGLLFASVGTRFLSRSKVVRTDGIRSVRAAFTIEEAARLAWGAGLANASVTPHWPRRWILEWRRT
ncbi:MAG: methyltransferase domain-containing protein [Candidatus Sumerlaeia bacterium]